MIKQNNLCCCRVKTVSFELSAARCKDNEKELDRRELFMLQLEGSVTNTQT